MDEIRSGRTPPGKREATASVVADGDWSVYRALLDEGVSSQAAEKVFQRTMELLRAHPGRFVEIAVRLAP
jgi:hypothetical protein